MQTFFTSKIAAVIIGLVAVSGAGYVYVSSESFGTSEEVAVESEVKAEGEVRNTEDDTKDISTKGSLKTLLGLVGAQKCTVSQVSDISKSSGVFYLSDGKGRGDFESTVLSGPGAGVTMKTSMIMDAETIYTWDEGTKQGMKMSMVELSGAAGADASVSSSAGANAAADQFNQSYDYDCEKWVPSAGVFTPPSGVKFTDMSEMMKALPNIGASASGKASVSGSAGAGASGMGGMDMSAMCGSCDQAGAQRDACRAALGCK
jgi:hypothetical protein